MYLAVLWWRFLLSQALLSFSHTDPMLDPNRVTWWRQHWCPGPLVLSSNHVNQVVALTVYFSPSTSLVNGALDITLPYGFQPNVHHIFGVNYIGGEDYQVTIEGIQTPDSEGPYEPFTVRTWYNFHGQLADVNLNFGSVYIYGSPKEMQSLAVSVVGASAGTPINQSGCELSFKFAIQKDTLHFDLITISTDLQWSIASDALCYSSGLRSSNSSDFSPLPCLITPSTHSIYIHGLSVERSIPATDRLIDIRVTSVTSPDAVYLSSYWTVSLSYSTVATVLGKITSSSGPILKNGLIASASWTPTWGNPLGGIGTGQTLFLDLQFRVSNAIPRGNSPGYIEVDLSEEVPVEQNWVGNAVNCYIVTYLHRLAKCGIQGKTLTISQLPEIKAGSLISVRNVVKITSAADSFAQITAIRTYKGNIYPPSGFPIDIGLNLAAFKVASTNNLVPVTLRVGYHAPNSSTPVWTTGGSYINGQLQSYGLQFVIGNPVGVMQSSSRVVIECPFSGHLDDFAIAVFSPTWHFESNTNPDIEEAVSGAVAAVPVFAPGNSEKALGSITFPGTISLQAYQAYLHLEVTSAPYIQTPRIAANYATAYECRVSISTPERPIQTGYVQLPFVPSAWQVATVTIPCNDKVEGLPLIIDVQPSFSIPVSDRIRTFYVEVEFSYIHFKAALGTNLLPGQIAANDDPLLLAVPYPFSAANAVPSKAQLYTTTNASVVALSGFAGLEPSVSVRFSFPVGGFTSSDVLQVVVRSVYFLNSDPRHGFVAQQTTTSALSLRTQSQAWAGLEAASGTNKGVYRRSHSGLIIDAYLPSNGPSPAWNYIILPPGFTFSSSRILTSLVVGATISEIYWFSSPTERFPFPGVLFKAQSLFSTAARPAGSLSLAGFQASIGASTAQVRVVAGSTTEAACSANGVFPFLSLPGEILNLSISPVSTPQRSPNSLRVSHIVTFTLPNGAPRNSLIRLEFDTSKWTNPGKACSGCTATGLTAAYSDDNVTCELVGQRAEVRYFAALPAFSTVSISIFGLSPPREPAVAPFLLSLSTILPGYGLIDEARSLSNSTVTITPDPGLPGRPVWLAIKAFPPTVRTTEAHLYLRFSLPHALPACGEIAIFSPLTLSPQRNSPNYYCSTSPVPQSSCDVTGNAVYLTLSQDFPANGELEFFLEEFVTNPANLQPLQDGFRLTASWGGQVTDMDTGPLQSGQIYTPTAILTTLILKSALSPISFTPATAVEAATYTLDFKDLADFAVDDEFWVLFPREFDNFLGDVRARLSTAPNEYYIDCSCTQLAVSMCPVDRRTVIFKGKAPIPARTRVVITIKGVRNASDAMANQFKVYHVNAHGEFVSVNQKFGYQKVQPAVQNNIEVRKVTVSDNRLFTDANYAFQLSLKGYLDQFSVLRVEFPPEFSLKQEKYECNATWMDLQSENIAETAWNSAASCETDGHFLSFPAPNTPISLTNNHIVTLSLMKVANPQYSLDKTAFGELKDKAFWSGKFHFFLYQGGTLVGRSYANANSAFLVYEDPYKPFIVNNYDPVTRENRVIVRAGTQTGDIYVRTEGQRAWVTAKKVVFAVATDRSTPDEGRLKYTSEKDEWTMWQGAFSMQFRVAAAVSAVPGLYYLDWLITETSPVGGTQDYRPPVRTLVEVVGKQSGVCAFTVSPVPSLPIGSSSLPILVQTAHSPHTAVTVSISLAPSSALISVVPAVLTFAADINVQSFQIQVAKDYDLAQGSVLMLCFALAGVDAWVFSIVPSLHFQVIAANSAERKPGTVLSWNLGSVTKTSCSIAPVTDQTGVLYYHLAAKGTAVPSFAALKSAVSRPRDDFHRHPDPESEESWRDFQQRLYKVHLQTQWMGALSVYSQVPGPIVAFPWLWASTVYQITGYLEDLRSETPSALPMEYFATAAMAGSQCFSLSFQGLVYAAFNSTVQRGVAAVIGVPYQRIQGLGYFTHTENNGSAEVSQTAFTFMLLGNRFSDFIEPADLLQLSNTELKTLQSNLAVHRLPTPLTSLHTTEPPLRVTPTWQLPLSPGNSTQHSVTVHVRADTAGQVCCVAVTECAVPSAEQMLLGLSAANAPVSATCVSAEWTGNWVDLGGLQSLATYCVYCVATDNYPVWPTLSSMLGPVVLTTLSEETGLGNNSLNSKAMLLLVLVLIAA